MIFAIQMVGVTIHLSMRIAVKPPIAKRAMLPSANTHIQSAFLEQVRKRLPANLSFADEIAELLNISRDSAYRRIRGETVLSLDEVKILCEHFGVSLDALLSPSSEMVSFHHRVINQNTFTFDKWIKSILANLEMISGFEDKELFFCAKDAPPFHHFKFPELAAFKIFFWMKSLHRHPEFENKKFSIDIIPVEILEIGKRIWNKYASIPSTEIWSYETINVTLSQIEFYHENGFIDQAQAHSLCDRYLELVNHMRDCATTGTKDGAGKFTLYKNEILISDNTILFKMGDKRVTFITHNTMNILTTAQESFCQQTEEYIANLINKSSLISLTGEKIRNRFFNKMSEKILAKKAEMK